MHLTLVHTEDLNDINSLKKKGKMKKTYLREGEEVE